MRKKTRKVLDCFDRLVVTWTLTEVAYPETMVAVLYGVLLAWLQHLHRGRSYCATDHLAWRVYHQRAEQQTPSGSTAK